MARLSTNPLAQTISELHALEPSVHWFCDGPDGSKPTFDVDDDDGEDEKKNKYVLSTVARRDAAIESLQIFTYDQVEAQADGFVAEIDRQLGRCERCIVEYYKGRKRQVTGLKE